MYSSIARYITIEYGDGQDIQPVIRLANFHYRVLMKYLKILYVGKQLMRITHLCNNTIHIGIESSTWMDARIECLFEINGTNIVVVYMV